VAEFSFLVVVKLPLFRKNAERRRRYSPPLQPPLARRRATLRCHPATVVAREMFFSSVSLTHLRHSRTPCSELAQRPTYEMNKKKKLMLGLRHKPEKEREGKKRLLSMRATDGDAVARIRA
jgi:hypothetical protein